MFRLTKYYIDPHGAKEEVEIWHFKEKVECYLQACFEIQDDSDFKAILKSDFQDHIDQDHYGSAFSYYDEVTYHNCYKYEIEDFGNMHLDVPKIPIKRTVDNTNVY